jgi:hypothetical protein
LTDVKKNDNLLIIGELTNQISFKEERNDIVFEQAALDEFWKNVGKYLP